MTRTLFGTDGIRGPAGVYPLDNDGTRQIGKAIGKYFGAPGEMIMVGYDPRESSPALANALVEGLVSVGTKSVLVGVVPTPGLAYITKQSHAVCGVMITASHNPYTDNGIKVFTSDGAKLSDGLESKLNDLIDSEISQESGGESIDGSDELQIYEDFLTSTSSGLHDLNIALDTANGATSGIAQRVFTRLGTEAKAIFDAPNGRNINVKCGATDTTALQDFVIKNHLDAGLAFDGDGDRLIMVDSKGRKLTGDHILYILAMTGSYDGVVVTSMSNMGLETALNMHDIKMIRTDVGDRHVLDGLDKTGWVLGGEQSGHIIIKNLASTGDGMLAAIQVLANVKQSGKTLAEWYDELELLPQALINIQLDDKGVLDAPEIVKYIHKVNENFGDKGRLNIRPSGTEPKLRVMVEAQDADNIAQSIADCLKNLISTAGAQ